MKVVHFPFIGLLLVVLAVAAATASGLWRGGASANAELTVQEEDRAFSGLGAGETVANCRFGAVIHDAVTDRKWLYELGAGWWMNFQVDYELPPQNGAEFAHVIWINQKRDNDGNYLDDYDIIPDMKSNSLGHLIKRRPGRIWIVGNEVDRGPDPDGNPGQGDTMPEMYARIYHEVYSYIKKWDQTALVTPSALVEVTPGRIQYLNKVWDAYRARYGKSMPADLWNMHLYILPEMRTDGIPSYYANIAVGTDPALGILEAGGDPAMCKLGSVYCLAEHDDLAVFEEQVRRMRTWMKEHGQRDKPLIITEYSLLLPYELREPGGCWVQDEFGQCFTPGRVRDFAMASFAYLETTKDPDLGYRRDNDRLVQQWMWYSVFRTGHFSVSNLAAGADDFPDLTPAGQAFKDAASAVSPTVNLVAEEAVKTAGLPDADGFVNVNVAVLIRNNGNARVNEPIQVTFYRDKSLSEIIARRTIPGPNDDFTGMTGCAVRQLKVSATWRSRLTPGKHAYWVKVDSAGTIDEADETDNVARGSIEIGSTGNYLPLTFQ